MMTFGSRLGFRFLTYHDPALALAQHPRYGLRGELRAARRLESARVDVGDDLTVRIRRPGPRPVDVIRRQAVGVTQAGALAADEERRLRVDDARDLVHDLDARVSDEERRPRPDAGGGELLLQRAVVALQVLVDRRRRKPVAVDHLELRRARAAARDLGARFLGERSPGVRAGEEVALVLRLGHDLEEPQALEELGVDLAHDRVLGGGVVGAEAEERVGAVARADAGPADADPRRRRLEELLDEAGVERRAQVHAAVGRDDARLAAVERPPRGFLGADAVAQRGADHLFDLLSIDHAHPKNDGSPAR